MQHKLPIAGGSPAVGKGGRARHIRMDEVVLEEGIVIGKWSENGRTMSWENQKQACCGLQGMPCAC